MEALEALLQIRKSDAKEVFPQSQSIHPEIPVPNPLDPSQPHLIECDTSIHRVRNNSRVVSSSGEAAHHTFSVVSVPNPLLKPGVKASSIPLQHVEVASSINRNQRQCTATSSLTTSCSQSRHVTHGFTVNCSAVSGELTVREDMIRDALMSQPQRGKKRQNLSELERLELTRTRNREHAKSTRMKKKARHQELIEIEKKYLLLQEKEKLTVKRKKYLVKFVESVGSSPVTSICSHQLPCRLRKLACDRVRNAEFSVIGSSAETAVALTSENSGFLKVSVRGADVISGETTTAFGVLCAEFCQGSADITDVTLHWSPSQVTMSLAGIFPSVSHSSLE